MFWCNCWDSGELNFSELAKDDEIAIQQLVLMKGIGRRTAEVNLMFNLNRTDLLPLDDPVLESTLKRIYDLPVKIWKELAVSITEKMELVANCSLLVCLPISQIGEKRRSSVLKYQSC